MYKLKVCDVSCIHASTLDTLDMLESLDVWLPQHDVWYMILCLKLMGDIVQSITLDYNYSSECREIGWCQISVARNINWKGWSYPNTREPLAWSRSAVPFFLNLSKTFSLLTGLILALIQAQAKPWDGQIGNKPAFAILIHEGLHSLPSMPAILYLHHIRDIGGSLGCMS
jgi:hypothetical protein